MKNIWKKLPKPFIALAPLAGYTDQPFRIMCKKYGADLVYSEMISSEAIWHNKIRVKKQQDDNLSKTLSLIQFSKIERPYIVQIFGGNNEHVSFAGKYIASGEWQKDYLKILNSKPEIINNSKFKKDINSKKLLGFSDLNLEFESIPHGIDINMGCPVTDVVKQGAGAGLLRDMDKAVEIVQMLKKQVKNIPISVKTRLGWSDHKDILLFSKKLENAGVDAIAIHGRTYKEGFSGEVDYKMIEKVKKQVKIPIITNGGIKIDNCKLIIENCKVDGYMIGTGALGKPWIFDELKVKSYPSTKLGTSKLKVDWNFIKKNILKHAKLVQELKGNYGIVEFRKHLAWYLKGLPEIKSIRSKLMQVNHYQDIKKIFFNES